MSRLPQIDQSLSGSEAFAREFGEKIVNKLIALDVDAQKLGKDSHKLPPFIKKKDLWELSSVIKPFLSKFCESEAWLRRLTGADSKRGQDESRKRFLVRLEWFKEKLKEVIAKDSNEIEQYLPSLEKFALGTLRAFNEYTKPFRIAKKSPAHCMSFVNKNIKNSLQKEQAIVLTEVLGQLDRISENLITQEELRFKKTKEYREAGSPFAQRGLLNKHMNLFREALSVEENLQYLERVLKSQQPPLKRTLTKDEKATLTKEEKEQIVQEEKKK
ncbi:hypothetical protein [Legionella tunisiensis]|uniref:hypothetical protein n=1 Tax=Legionella tunisiensis TaxID=1034944 RepID=UPI0002D6CA44|nr:hypothetical protein [Legionella tunisiensis]